MQDLLKRWGIALTGGIGTGKSTVAAMLAKAGVPVLDADRLAREVTAPGTPGLAAVATAFGPGVLAADGALDRKALGRIVFADAAARQRLEALTHPLIRAALLAELRRRGLEAAPRPFVYEASLIFETGTEGDFREVWVTYCSPDVQLGRVMARDGLPRERAEAVVASQLGAKHKADRAALVIDTSGSLASVETQVKKALPSL